MRKYWGPLLVTISTLIIGTDQLIKYFVNQKLQGSPGVFFINTSWLQAGLVLSHNPYIAFSVPIPIIITITISLLFLVIISVLLIQTYKKNEKRLSLLYTLVLAGALGNFIDRITTGVVTDYISIGFGSWHFAIFNLADSAITVGIILILLCELKTEHHANIENH